MLCIPSCYFASMYLTTVSIVHCSQDVFKAISCICTELLYIGPRWRSCHYTSKSGMEMSPH